MNWIAPYRDAITAQAALLQRNGFSWIGEDDNCIKFTDGQIMLTFCVQRYEEALEVLIRHLGEQAGDEEYRVDLVMRMMDGASTLDFADQTPEERSGLVGRYVEYILKNKTRLFGATCPYAKEYGEFNRRLMEQLMAQWTRKP